MTNTFNCVCYSTRINVVEKNFYNRFKLDYSNEIEIENISNIIFEKNYEIEIIDDKKQQKYNKIVVTQYLIK